MPAFDKSVETGRLFGVARIVFRRFSAQLSSLPAGDDVWKHGLEGFKKNPEQFPFIEACIDSAGEILRYLDSEQAE